MLTRARKGLRRPLLKVREDLFLRRIDLNRIPRHVAIIMDGNGRWARRRGLPRIEGHKAGIETTREVIRTAAQIKIDYLTLYTFSVENWQRPKEEVSALMNLFEDTLEEELEELDKNKIKVNILGDIPGLPESTQKSCYKATELTKDNTGLNLNIALNYGGRQEITQALRKITQEIKDTPGVSVSEENINRYLYTAGMPDPELLIRTGGEFRLSNFLLWQVAYTELWISSLLWPDFNRSHFLRGILHFQRRKRRFGGLGEQDLA